LGSNLRFTLPGSRFLSERMGIFILLCLFAATCASEVSAAEAGLSCAKIGEPCRLPEEEVVAMLQMRPSEGKPIMQVHAQASAMDEQLTGDFDVDPEVGQVNSEELPSDYQPLPTKSPHKRELSDRIPEVTQSNSQKLRSLQKGVGQINVQIHDVQVHVNVRVDVRTDDDELSGFVRNALNSTSVTVSSSNVSVNWHRSLDLMREGSHAEASRSKEMSQSKLPQSKLASQTHVQEVKETVLHRK